MFGSSAIPARGARTAAVVVVAGATLFAMTACGSSATPAADDSATSGTVDWWGWDPQQVTAEKYIAAFNEEYPDITVNFKQTPINEWDAALRPALASGEGPDVYNIAPGGGIGSIATFGSSAEDLTPIVEDALGAEWESKVAPNGPAGLTTEDGKLAGLSVGSTYAGTLWINKDVFDANGLTAPTTLDEWVDVCATLRASGTGCFTQGVGQVAFNQDTLQAIADSVEPGWWTAASRGDESWDSDVMVETLEIWKSLFDDGIMDEGALGLQQYPDANNNFLSGKSPMVMMGTWYTPNTTVAAATAAIEAAGVTGAEPFTMVPVLFPDVAGKGNPPALFGDANYGLAINSRSDAKNAAATFVTWMTTQQDGQQVVANALNDIASLNGVQPDWSAAGLVNAEVQQPILEDIQARAAESAEPRLSLVSAALQQAIGVASTSVAEGTATPAEAAATLQQAVGQ